MQSIIAVLRTLTCVVHTYSLHYQLYSVFWLTAEAVLWQPYFMCRLIGICKVSPILCVLVSTAYLLYKSIYVSLTCRKSLTNLGRANPDL